MIDFNEIDSHSKWLSLWLIIFVSNQVDKFSLEISSRRKIIKIQPLLSPVYTRVKIFTIDSGQEEAYRKEKDLLRYPEERK